MAEFVAANPRVLDGWAELGDLGRDAVESYSAYRVGYHRGLDALRANGWRGSGYVRWSSESNHGFLRCLLGLQNRAAEIGELGDNTEALREAIAADGLLRSLLANDTAQVMVLG
ncbi:MAG: DUF3151 family protein, partial [Ilumatobacteraceae bacterium]